MTSTKKKTKTNTSTKMSYSIGSLVELKCRARSINLFSDEEYDYFTVKGTVIKPFYHTESKSVFVRTDDMDVPVRVIHHSLIVDSNLKPAVEEDTKVIPVGNYFVTVSGGKVSCTCVGFQYRRYCKHSTPYKEE